MSITAMKQALEALEFEFYDDNIQRKLKETITALRTAIEEAEKQEPVACVIDGDLYFHHEIDWEDLAYQGHGVELLYTTPPAAQPAVPLTDDLYRAIESMIESHEAGDLDGWEVQLVKRRLREAAHGITGETK
jgi:hypothetical protein